MTFYTSFTAPDGQDRHVVLAPDYQPPTGAITRLNSGNAYEVAQEPQAKDGYEFVDLANVATRFSDLQAEINSQFIARHEMVEAAAVTLAAGKTIFVESPPGAAKTRLFKSFADGIESRFWSNILDTDMTKDDLLGPMSAKSISNDLWERVWMAVADNEIIYLDEIWKAGGRVTNLLLGAIEEKIVTSGNVTRRIPLISAFASSNEVPQEKGEQAIWDRWLVRLSLKYIGNRDDFRSLFGAKAGRKAIKTFVTADEIRLMAAASEAIAENAPAEVIDKTEELWTQFGRQHSGISDRRWMETMRLAAAKSLLECKPFGPEHLSVARWTLWVDTETRQDRIDTILASLDTGMATLLRLEADLSDIALELEGLDLSDPANDVKAARLTGQARKLVKDAETVSDPQHKTRIDAIIAQANEIQDKALGI